VFIALGSTEAPDSDSSDSSDSVYVDRDLERLYDLFSKAEDMIVDGVVAQDLK